MSVRATRLLAAIAVATSAPKYVVTDLGGIAGGYDLSFVADINDQGWVTGIAHGEFGRRAVSRLPPVQQLTTPALPAGSAAHQDGPPTSKSSLSENSPA